MKQVQVGKKLARVGLAVALAIGLGGVGVGCWAEEVKQAPPVSEWASKPHGGTKEAFDMVMQDLKSTSFQVNTKFYNGDVNGCMGLLTALKDGKAEYIAPKFTTDDYYDSRLEPYKKKYHDHVSKIDSPDRLALDIFGALVFDDRGVPDMQIPTRNFALYELDLDGDSENEIIFYGEDILPQAYVNPYMPIKVGNGAIYITYKNYISSDSVSVQSPYSGYGAKGTAHAEPNNYSSIFGYLNRFYVIDVAIGDEVSFLKISNLNLAKIKGAIYSRRDRKGLTCPFISTNQNSKEK